MRRAAAVGRVVPGPDAAHSQDFRMARMACRYGGGRYLGLDRRIGIRDRRCDGCLGAAYGAGLQEMGRGAHPAALDFGDCLAYGPTSPQVFSALYRRGFPEDGRTGGLPIVKR